MYDSRVTLYPFEETRRENSYLKTKDVKTATTIDESHNYILQRKVIFANLFQRRLRVTLPGNFSLSAGNNADIEIPNRFVEKDVDGIDETLSGKYIITSVRHIIRYDKHETILEVATDSQMKKQS